MLFFFFALAEFPPDWAVEHTLCWTARLPRRLFLLCCPLLVRVPPRDSPVKCAWDKTNQLWHEATCYLLWTGPILFPSFSLKCLTDLNPSAVLLTWIWWYLSQVCSGNKLSVVEEGNQTLNKPLTQWISVCQLLWVLCSWADDTFRSEAADIHFCQLDW